MKRHAIVAAVACALSLLLSACGEDAGTPLARVVEHSESDRREIALTFDAGVGGSTDPARAAEILRILREHGVRATFSLTGLWAETNRDLLFTIAADGHQIINGTYAGEPWAGLSSDERKLALSRTEVTVYRYTSRSTLPYFRPPSNQVDDSVRRDAAAHGYETILLSSVYFTRGPRVVLPAAVLGFADPGDIVQLGIGDLESDSMDGVIAAIRDAGYALVTIDTLLAP